MLSNFIVNKIMGFLSFKALHIDTTVFGSYNITI